MMKKLTYLMLCLALLFTIVLPKPSLAAQNVSQYTKTLTKEQKQSICSSLKSGVKAVPQASTVGAGVVPDSVMQSIYNTTGLLHGATSLIMTLGSALTCHATRTDKQFVSILGIKLFSYPNIPVWICGAIVFCMGFMITLSITFYLVDIAFKLGIAVILLPVGIALWPFPPTNNKLSALISVILHNAAIFAFLGLTVTYAIHLLSAAVGDLGQAFNEIETANTDAVSNRFTLASTGFIVIVFALAYGMKLIGSTVADFADKFFPDNAVGGGQGASPIHGAMTQGMDFVKKKAIQPAVSFASDVAETQLGRATAAIGRKIEGNGKGVHGFMGGMMVAVGTKMQQHKKSAAAKEREEYVKAVAQAKRDKDEAEREAREEQTNIDFGNQ